MRRPQKEIFGEGSLQLAPWKGLVEEVVCFASCCIQVSPAAERILPIAVRPGAFLWHGGTTGFHRISIVVHQKVRTSIDVPIGEDEESRALHLR